MPSELNMGIQLWLTFGKPQPYQIRTMINVLAKPSDTTVSDTFRLYYPKGSTEADGRASLDYNGGYHTLACLYAAAGDIPRLEKCFEWTLQNDMRFYFELGRLLNNHLNTIGYLYQYGHHQYVPEILKWLSAHTNDNPPVTIIRNVILRSGYLSRIYPINLDRDVFRSTRGYYNPNLCFASRDDFDAMMSDYDSIVNKDKSGSERNFLLAMNAKRKVMFYHKYWYERSLPVDSSRLTAWCKQAIDYYNAIDKDYREGTESITTCYNGDGVRTRVAKRNDLFLYPDYRDGWFSLTYHTDYFFNYLVKKHDR